MKKSYLTLGLIAAAAFTFTNCAQELENPNQKPEVVGYPFEIVANAPATKTVNDDMATKWVANDAINLFHAESETTEYSSNNEFTITEENLEAGKFTGTLTEPLADVNDWYALYPYNANIKTPGPKDAGYTYIGYSSGLNQTGYNSMASLKGSVCPLYGIATEVEAGDTPEMTMRHLSAVVEIKVTNMNDEPLNVTTASMVATEDVVGSYFIDITKYPVEYTPSAANYVKSTATVNVSGGTELAKNESASLYLAIKPFTAPAGQKLTFSVNGYEKELDLTQDVTFTAGKIKTVNFAYDKVSAPVEPEPEGVTSATLTFDADKANRTSLSTEKQVWEQNGIKFTNDKAQSTTNVADYGNPVRLYKGSTFTIEAPGYITKIVFNSSANINTSTYFDFLKASVGECSVDGTDVTVVLSGTSSSVTYSAAGGQVRLYGLTVYYATDGYVAPTLESISVADYQTEFTEGDTFAFGGTVTAHWSNDTETNVTNDAEYSGYNMSVTGTQTVTVAYEGKTCTYDITVSEKPQGDATTGVPATTACYTLSTSSIQGSNNSYAGNCDIDVNGITWNVTGNTKINPWRIGGKNLTNQDRTVYSKTAYSSALSKVEFVSGDITATWNSMKLEYSTNADFSNAQTLQAAAVGANKTIAFAPDGGFPENCYFRFTLNVNAGGSNQYVQLKEIKFYGYN